MSDVSPTDKSVGIPYRAQYAVPPGFRKYWHHLFHGANLTETELRQFTDNFIRMVSDCMKQILNRVIQQQKEREQERKESEGG